MAWRWGREGNGHLLSVPSKAGTFRCVSLLNPQNDPESRNDCPHHIDEAQRDYVSCPGPQSRQDSDPGLTCLFILFPASTTDLEPHVMGEGKGGLMFLGFPHAHFFHPLSPLSQSVVSPGSLGSLQGGSLLQVCPRKLRVRGELGPL